MAPPIIRVLGDVNTTPKFLAKGTDLLSTGLNFEQPGANVAAYYGIPLVSLHHYPYELMASSSQTNPVAVGRSRSTMTAIEWLLWRVDNAQRQHPGLPNATRRSPRRIAERGSLKIQAYDKLCWLPDESQSGAARVPFVGALTKEHVEFKGLVARALRMLRIACGPLRKSTRGSHFAGSDARVNRDPSRVGSAHMTRKVRVGQDPSVTRLRAEFRRRPRLDRRGLPQSERRRARSR